MSIRVTVYNLMCVIYSTPNIGKLIPGVNGTVILYWVQPAPELIPKLDSHISISHKEIIRDSVHQITYQYTNSTHDFYEKKLSMQIDIIALKNELNNAQHNFNKQSLENIIKIATELKTKRQLLQNFTENQNEIQEEIDNQHPGKIVRNSNINNLHIDHQCKNVKYHPQDIQNELYSILRFLINYCENPTEFFENSIWRTHQNIRDESRLGFYT